jgi:hypothetical protein
MKRKLLLSCAAALLLFLLPGIAMWAQSQDQPSLGDVARQKSAAKAKRVVTNDEIPPSPEADKPPSSPAAEPSATGAAAKPGTTPAAKQDGAKSDSAPEKQTRLQELMTDRERLQKILKKMQDQVAETNDEQRKATLGEVVRDAQEALDANQKEIDHLRASGPAAENTPAANPPAADHSPGGQPPPK